MTYPNPPRTSGSAKPIEPPVPGHRKAATLDDPKPVPSGGSEKPSPKNEKASKRNLNFS
jgi:hypothetical protein